MIVEKFNKLSRRIIEVLTVSLLLVSCQTGKKEEIKEKIQVSDPTPYVFCFSNDLPKDIKSDLEERSKLFLLKDSPPSGVVGLYQRIKSDRKDIEKYLFSKGYLDAKVKFSLDEVEKPEEFPLFPRKEKILISRVQFQIKLNERYKIQRVGVSFIGKKPSINIKSIWKSTNLKKFSFMDGDSILKGEEFLREFYANNGYPFVKVFLNKVYINRRKKTLDIHYSVDSGNQHTFGESLIPKSDTLDEIFIRRRIAWKKGDIYNESLIDRSRKRLVESNIFSGVNIKPSIKSKEYLKEKNNVTNKGPNPTPIPISIDVKESPPRQIGAGLRFSSSKGSTIKLFWRHFNLNGGGESFSANILFGKLEKELNLRYVVPDFIRKSQELSNVLVAKKEKTKAYKGKSISYETLISPPITGGINGSTGPSIGKSNLIDNDNKKFDHFLFGWKFGVNIDKTDDLLNPTSGFRLSPAWTPYFGKLNSNEKKMSIGIIDGSFYLPFGDIESPFVVASWFRSSRIFVKKFQNIPFNKRIYAGGDGSVRGYGFQMVSELKSDGTPIGGRNLVEGGVELRVPIKKDIGMVAFIDGGNVNSYDSFKFEKKNTLWGFGLGARYYSPIGPIRVDIAFPLKKRKSLVDKKDVDSSFQIYLSIGQAF